MDLSKSYEFFQPEKCRERIHLIGCGSVGSTLAELLTRLGLTRITLYDFDTVEDHNLANQMFTQADVGKKKTDAVAERLRAINPLIRDDLIIEPEGWKGQKLSGYVFLAVDNIDLRRRIAKENEYNPFIRAMFDFRTRLTDAQHYAADWSKPKMKRAFFDSMAFTQEEADAETPVSACNVSLCVAPTVWNVCTAGVANFIRFVNQGEIQRVVLIDAFSFFTQAA